MSSRPALTQVCRSQACHDVIVFDGGNRHPGWGVTKTYSVYMPVIPKAAVFTAIRTDDIATVWVNGTMVYHLSTCVCAYTCSGNVIIDIASYCRAGNNTIDLQVNDVCGVASGTDGAVTLTVDYL